MINALFAIVVEKDKEVKAEGASFALECIRNLGEAFIESKIKDQRPYIQESLRHAIKKLVCTKNESQIINSEQNIHKRLKFEGSDSKAKETEDSNGHQKLKIDGGMISDFNFNVKVALKSVLHFSEPTDSEIRTLNSSFNSFLSETVISGLFSFQCENLNHTVELLRHLNFLNKANSLLFFQYMYLRLYDTNRNLIFQSMEKLLNLIVVEMTKNRTIYTTKIETTIVFNSILRYYYTCCSPEIRLLIQAISFLNLSYFSQIMLSLLSKTDLNFKVFEFFEEIASHFGNTLEVGRDFLFAIYKHIKNSPKPITNIVIKLLEGKSKVLRDDDSEIEALYQMLITANSKNEHRISFKNEDMFQELLTKSKKMNDVSHGCVNVGQFIALVEAISGTKNILSKLNLNSRFELFRVIIDMIGETSNNDKIFFSSEDSKIDPQEVASILRANIRTMIKWNSEDICASIFLDIINMYSRTDCKDMKSQTGNAFVEMKLAFKILSRKIIAQAEEIDFTSLFEILGAYLRVFGKDIHDVGVGMIRSLFVQINSSKIHHVADQLASFGDLTLIEFWKATCESFQQQEETEMIIEHEDKL